MRKLLTRPDVALATAATAAITAESARSARPAGPLPAASLTPERCTARRAPGSLAARAGGAAGAGARVGARGRAAAGPARTGRGLDSGLRARQPGWMAPVRRPWRSAAPLVAVAAACLS